MSSGVRMSAAAVAVTLTAFATITSVACGTRPPEPSSYSSAVFTTAHATFGSAGGDFFNIRPTGHQPLAVSHKPHIEKQAMCTDCHETVERGPVAGIPSVKTCMICHSQIATDRPL